MTPNPSPASHPRRARRAFSLLELVLSMVVVSVIAGVITPIMMSATDAYAASNQARQATDDATFAVNTLVRMIREAPAGEDTPLGIASASDEHIIFSNDHGFRLNADTLERVTPDLVAPLVRDVESFSIEYLAADGRTTALTPDQAHRVHFTLQIRGVTVTAAAFPRVNFGAAP